MLADQEPAYTERSEGIDGPWSTFELRVGTPAQNIRFLPGTSSTLTTVVLPEGCQGQPKDCAENRGGVFNKTASTTWSEIGLFNLGFEKGLGYNDNGDFGHDTGTWRLRHLQTLHEVCATF